MQLAACNSWQTNLCLTANSNTRPFFSEGSPVVYDRVVETLGQNGEGGSVEHTFTFVAEQQDGILPFIGASPNSWKRGLPINTIYYDAAGNKVKEEQNTYATGGTAPATYYQLTGGKLAFLYYCPADINFTKTVINTMRYVSEWQYLSQSKTITYGDAGTTPLTQTTSYFYDNPAHIQPTRIQVTQSDGSIRQVRMTYPGDYAATAGSSDPMLNALAKMVVRNQVAEPVEKVESVIRGGQEYIVAAGISLWKEYSAGNIYNSAVYRLDLAGPAAYTPLSISNGSVFSMNGAYRKLADYRSYNSQGKLTEAADAVGTPTSVKYGYGDLLPLLYAQNATAAQVYYNGFEELASGYSTTAKFGQKAYNGIFSIPGSALQAGTYLLGWWQYNGSQWTYQTQQITHNGSTAIAVGNGGIIDEVTVRPPAATVSSFSHDPSVGVTARTADNGSGLRFEFDDLGRLRCVRDHNGYILKASTYQYQTQ